MHYEKERFIGGYGSNIKVKGRCGNAAYVSLWEHTLIYPNGVSIFVIQEAPGCKYGDYKLDAILELTRIRTEVSKEELSSEEEIFVVEKEVELASETLVPVVGYKCYCCHIL